MARKTLLHIKSNVVENGRPKLPQASQLLPGEIAVNYADGYETLSIKNSNDEIVTFTNDETFLAYIDEQDKELATAAGIAMFGDSGLTLDVANFAYSANSEDYYLSAATSLYEADGILSETILENERVTAEGLNDLNTRVNTISGNVTTVQNNLNSLSQRTDAAIEDIYDTIENLDAIDVDNTLTKTEVQVGDKTKYVLGVKIDSGLDLTSPYPVANSAVSTVIKEDEEVIAASLNDLNSRLNELSGSVEGFDDLADAFSAHTADTTIHVTASDKAAWDAKQNALSAGTGIDITDDVISCTLDTQISEFVSTLPASGLTSKLYFVPNSNTGATTGNTYIEYAWHVTGATPDAGEWEELGEWAPDLTIDSELDLDSTNPVENQAISSAITRIEIVTSAALNNINVKLGEVSGTVVDISDAVSGMYTADEIDDMIDDVRITVDDEFDSGSTNPVENRLITSAITTIDKVTSAALNDLNGRLSDTTSDVNSLDSQVEDLNTQVNQFGEDIEDIWDEINNIGQLTANTLTGITVNSKNGTVSNNRATVTIGGADVKLSGYTHPVNNTDDDPVSSANTVNQAFANVVSAMTDTEEVMSSAINALHDELVDTELDVAALSGAVQDIIDNPVEPMVETTYSDLVTLKNGGNLAAGSWYRITDYQCTTTQTNTSAATHQFDVVVLALSNDTLSEEARAIKHSGDTYFSGSTVNAWKIWYSLENTNSRFAWADTTNGKGVIYRMIDEWENDCAYDFKNILFQRKLTNGSYDTGGTNTWCYTFNAVLHNSDNETYGTCEDASLIHGLYNDEPNSECVKNVIPLLYSTTASDRGGIDGQAILNDNVFLGEYYLEDGEYFYGNFACCNVFGIGSKENTFSLHCCDNIFGSYCGENVIGAYCFDNAIGNNFYGNTIGSNFYGNIIGNSFTSNTVGNNFRNNTIGNRFESNIIGNYFDCNTIGNYLYQNTIGTGTGSTATTIDYVKYICIEDGVRYVNITTTATTSMSDYLQNIAISRGVEGIRNNRKTITHPTVNDTFKTTYQPANSQVISV